MKHIFKIVASCLKHALGLDRYTVSLVSPQYDRYDSMRPNWQQMRVIEQSTLVYMDHSSKYYDTGQQNKTANPSACNTSFSGGKNSTDRCGCKRSPETVFCVPQMPWDSTIFVLNLWMQQIDPFVVNLCDIGKKNTSMTRNRASTCPLLIKSRK